MEGVKRKIEALKGLPEVDGRATQSQLQLLLCPPLDFVFHQSLEKIDVGQLLGDRLLRADVERRQDAGQPQILQLGDEQMIQLHDPPPDVGRKSVTGRANSGDAADDTGGGAAGVVV